MELTKIEIKVPKEMTIYMNYHNPKEELERNAMTLYPYIRNMTISHGRAAEILGVDKVELIELYNEIGLPYLNMDISEVEEDMQVFQGLKEVMV